MITVTFNAKHVQVGLSKGKVGIIYDENGNSFMAFFKCQNERQLAIAVSHIDIGITL